jgi:arsenate reductase (thioredoxin)
MKKKILVLCAGNSSRSQMAHGYLDHFANNALEVYSAGLEKHGVNPKAMMVMKEDGIDISRYTSNNVKEYEHIDFDFVLTVCDQAKANCPYFPAKIKTFHYNFPDPAKAKGDEKQVMDQFRIVRDMVRKYVRDFVQNYVSVSS